MKTQAQAFDKWVKGVRAGQANYVAGIDNPKRDWSTATAAASGAWAAGVATAASNGHFARGVQAAGVDAKWKAHAKGKGATRWQTSVNDVTTQNAYKTGLAKLYSYLAAGESAIASHPRGSIEENLTRAHDFALAVHNAKLAAK